MDARSDMTCDYERYGPIRIDTVSKPDPCEKVAKWGDKLTTHYEARFAPVKADHPGTKIDSTRYIHKFEKCHGNSRKFFIFQGQK